MTIREAQKENPQPPFCSICNAKVEDCHPNAVACICASCVQVAISKAANASLSDPFAKDKEQLTKKGK